MGEHENLVEPKRRLIDVWAKQREIFGKNVRTMNGIRGRRSIIGSVETSSCKIS